MDLPINTDTTLPAGHNVTGAVGVPLARSSGALAQPAVDGYPTTYKLRSSGLSGGALENTYVYSEGQIAIEAGITPVPNIPSAYRWPALRRLPRRRKAGHR